jgi:hypothetical protein
MTMSLARWFLMSLPIAMAKFLIAIEQSYDIKGAGVRVGAQV